MFGSITLHCMYVHIFKSQLKKERALPHSKFGIVKKWQTDVLIVSILKVSLLSYIHQVLQTLTLCCGTHIGLCVQ